jgi:hypothetical protein
MFKTQPILMLKNSEMQHVFAGTWPLASLLEDRMRIALK